MAASRRDVLDRLDRLPWWVSLVVGVVAVVVGVALASRPLTSLTVLGPYLGATLLVVGVAELVGDGEVRRWRDVARAAAWMVLGILVLTWLRNSFDLMALAVGAALVVDGVARAGESLRAGGADRVGGLFLGAAEVLLGVLAVRWPDLALLALAMVFAVRLVVLGVGRVRQSVLVARGRPSSGTDPSRRPVAPWARLVGSTLALLLAVGAVGLGIAARSGAPAVDDFYATPEDLPAEPGVLLRSEPFTRDVPADAVAWRILHTTTDAHGSPATSSAIVLAPRSAGGGPLPVVAWAHGTTGFAAPCAPSLLEHPFEAGAMPALDHVVERGWAVVATDYTGLGTPGPHPYLIGPGEGHSVLDSLRAARQLEGLHLAPETVVWGHSQGGHAALWAGQLASEYAPELEVVGIAAMSPAADVPALAANLPDATLGELFSAYVLAAYASHYPDVTLEAQVIAPARTLVREMAGRCLAEPSILASLASVVSVARDRSVYAVPPEEGALGARLRENVPVGPFPAPVLVAQGLADSLVLPHVQQDYVDGLCAERQDVDYRVYPGRNHLDIVEPDSALVPELVDWTAARLSGAAPRAASGSTGSGVEARCRPIRVPLSP